MLLKILPVDRGKKGIPDKKGTNYYPFGLAMAGISDKAVKQDYAENKYRYNSGNELQNKEFSDGSGLEMYDANFRGYDPQLGRFWQIDPLAETTENWSPYTFANDNPILLNDPLGADTTCPGCLPAVIVTPPPPAPPSPIDIKPVDVSGGPPNITANPPPSQVAPPTIDPGDYWQAKMLGYDPYDPIAKVRNTVVDQPSWWDTFVEGPFYRGKNVFGEELYTKHYGGPITGAVTSVNLEGEAESAYTTFQNISKRIRALSTTNFAIGVTSAKFEAAMAKAVGKAWEVSRDGKVKTIIYNGLKYVSRLSTEGAPTIDVYREGELLQKYRLQK
jgi:RHS repeat-associated protein